MKKRLNGYIGLYKGKQHKIYAANRYEAQLKLAAILKVKKTYKISMFLYEKAKKEVLQVATN